MKKRICMLLARFCYAAGVFASIYVGVWLMLFEPVREVVTAFHEHSLTVAVVAVCILKIVLSTTFAGLVWSIGYIGYNFFRGQDDPDWEALDRKFQIKKEKRTEGK